jgi:ATP-dependent DNA helicase RecG
MIERRLDARILKTRDNYVSKLKAMGISTMRDLLLYFPRNYRDEQAFTTINMMRKDELSVVQGTIKSIFTSRTKTGKAMTRAVVADSTGEVPVLWFNQTHLAKLFHKGSQIILTGKLKFERGKSIMMSPKYEKPAKTLVHTGRIVPVYAESEHITSKWMREKIHMLLPYCQYFTDELPMAVVKKEALMSLKDAIYHVHFAEDEEHLTKARERLAFEELFVLQFLSLKRKYDWKHSFVKELGKVELTFDPSSLKPFYDSLPFELTGAQKRVILEIVDDMNAQHPMLRLVQGDVGSGKTVVAASAIFLVKLLGRQSALMAPTGILAKQHYKKLVSSLTPFGFNVQLLTGSTGAKERRAILLQLASGTCDLVIGTHALIQEDVVFKDLALAVVDEQHRFGVKQRNMFQTNATPHMLSLSATPIPRTMALTIYGDQDLSLLDEMPPGRQEIVTRIVPEKKRNDAYIWIADQVLKGRQAFIVCPLVEESETLQLKSAVEEYERLKEDVFPEQRLALLHGRMKAKEKDEVMKAFAGGELDILVSTSVVEVGIDVPNASIMMIEGAERFGLAQLHQFRGRVGRGEHQSYCFLFSQTQSSDGLRRLKNMEKYDSGFDLAEIDLQMRGPGEVFGVKQSGLPDLKIANLNDFDFLMRVRRAVEKLIEKDPLLRDEPLFRAKMAKIKAYLEMKDM